MYSPSPTDTKTSLQYILYNAPYGSLRKMTEDLSLVYDFSMSSKEVQEAILHHQQDNYELFTGEDSKVIVSKSNYKEGEDEAEGFYWDAITGKKYKVNHFNGTITESEDYEEAGGDDNTKILGAAVQKYLEEFFGGDSHVTAVKNGDDYELIYTCKVKKAGSFYNGAWVSHWVYTAETKKLTGKVHLKAHMYENGNAFFNDIKEVDEELEESPENHKEFTQALLTLVMGVERKLVKRLKQHYEKDAPELFKSIRVFLPFTRERINWDINIQQVVQTLRNNDNNE